MRNWIINQHHFDTKDKIVNISQLKEIELKAFMTPCFSPTDQPVNEAVS